MSSAPEQIESPYTGPELYRILRTLKPDPAPTTLDVTRTMPFLPYTADGREPGALPMMMPLPQHLIVFKTFDSLRVYTFAEDSAADAFETALGTMALAQWITPRHRMRHPTSNGIERSGWCIVLHAMSPTLPPGLTHKHLASAHDRIGEIAEIEAWSAAHRAADAAVPAQESKRS
jgi:hypothetical protein